MTRRLLDSTVPGLYVVAILLAVFLGNGTVVTAVCVIGAILVGMYFSAIRRHLPTTQQNP